MKKNRKNMVFPIGKRFISLLTLILLISPNPGIAKTIDEIDKVGKNVELLKTSRVILAAMSHTISDETMEKTKQKTMSETAGYRNLTIIFFICSLYRIWRLTYGYKK